MSNYKKIIKGQPLPKGADAYDFLMSGWTKAEVIEWAKGYVIVAVKDYKLIIQNNIEINISTDPGNGQISESLIALYERLDIPRTDNKTPIANIDAVLKILCGVEAFKNLIWFDEFHNKCFTKWDSKRPREWTTIDELTLCSILQREFGLKRLGPETVYQACAIYAHHNTTNEPKDWLNALSWDGIPRIGKFFIDCLGAEDNEYTRAASKNWWISMVARIYSPGCKVDNMVILEGEQGNLKSTALGIIGGSWYAEIHESVTSKDFYQSLEGKLLIEISELESFSRLEANAIKKVITCRVDRYRATYDRKSKDHPRQCVFAGTTNDDAYLKDPTGGRRFWPIKTGIINLELIQQTREQLFAEAKALFQKGEKWYIMPKILTQNAQELRRQEDAWENIISEYLIGKQEVRLEELAYQSLNIDKGKLTMNEQRRIGKILTRLGLIKKNVSRNGMQMKVWVLPNNEDNPE